MNVQKLWKLPLNERISKSFYKFVSDDCTTLAACLAFYTLFAMPPLLFLLVTIVSFGMSMAFEPEQAELKAAEFLQSQAKQLIGNSAAAAEIGKIIENSRNQSDTWWHSLLSLAGVVVGATGLMAALQSSLNRVWGVVPVDGAFARTFIWKRMLSLAMILGFGFLLLVSFVLSTVLSTFVDFAASRFEWTAIFSGVVSEFVSILTTCFGFAAIFRFMPDAKVPWKHAFAGASLTVGLFTIGRAALYYYLSATNPAEQLGSASAALVVILLWFYYSSMILLYGAEFTFALSPKRVEPEAGAVKTTNPQAT